MADHTILLYVFLASAWLALGDAALAHWHLYRKIDPDPWRRGFDALFQYFTLLGIWLSFWGIGQSVTSLFVRDDAPLIPILLATVLTRWLNSTVLKKPTKWQGRRPFLSRDRRYDGFMQVVADRASTVRGKPEARDDYLDQLYRDDRVRLQVLAAYMDEHRDHHWIPLEKHQRAYHPRYNKLRFTALYLFALTPVIVPYSLQALDPNIFANNADLTAVTALLASLFYGPLFDAGARTLLFAAAAILVLGLGILMEFERSRPVAPGFAGLVILAVLAIVMAHYVENYVIKRNDTPLMAATEFVLSQLAYVEGKINDFGWVAGLFNYRDEINTVESLSADIRQTVLQLQSMAGSLFILPALLFWGGLSFAAIWEMHFSEAAEVTFRSRMRKPEL